MWFSTVRTGDTGERGPNSAGCRTGITVEKIVRNDPNGILMESPVEVLKLRNSWNEEKDWSTEQN